MVVSKRAEAEKANYLTSFFRHTFLLTAAVGVALCIFSNQRVGSTYKETQLNNWKLQAKVLMSLCSPRFYLPVFGRDVIFRSIGEIL